MKFNLEYLTNQLNFNIEDISLKELNFDELRYNLFSYWRIMKRWSLFL